MKRLHLFWLLSLSFAVFSIGLFNVDTAQAAGKDFDFVRGDGSSFRTSSFSSREYEFTDPLTIKLNPGDYTYKTTKEAIADSEDASLRARKFAYYLPVDSNGEVIQSVNGKCTSALVTQTDVDSGVNDKIVFKLFAVDRTANNGFCGAEGVKSSIAEGNSNTYEILFFDNHNLRNDVTGGGKDAFIEAFSEFKFTNINGAGGVSVWQRGGALVPMTQIEQDNAEAIEYILSGGKNYDLSKYSFWTLPACIGDDNGVVISSFIAVQWEEGNSASRSIDVWEEGEKLGRNEPTQEWNSGNDNECLFGEGVNRPNSAYINNKSNGDLGISIGSGSEEWRSVSRLETAPAGFVSNNAAPATCERDGGSLAWIICPIFNTMAETLPSIFVNFIEPLLQFNALSVSEAAGDNAIYEVWRNFRAIANVLFVITLFVIIMSQTFAINIEAYQIKKMLPRLVVAVIAVQISFFLSGLVVDVANVLGVGIKGLIESATPNSGGNTYSLDFSSFAPGLQFFAFVAVTWQVVTSALGILVGAVLALALTGFVLGLRQIILIFMVLLAPVAFVAWVLPNTEQLARKWFKNFVQLNMMFPLIVGLISIGNFAGKLISTNIDTFVSSVFTGLASIQLPGFHVFAAATPTQTAIFQAIALLATVAPYFMIPFTFKFAGSTMGMLGNVVTRGGMRGMRAGNAPKRAITGAAKGAAKIAAKQYMADSAAGATAFGRSRWGRVMSNPMASATSRGRRRLENRGIALEADDMKNLNKDELAAIVGGSDYVDRQTEKIRRNSGEAEAARYQTMATRAIERFGQKPRTVQAAYLKYSQEGSDSELNEALNASGLNQDQITTLQGMGQRMAFSQGRIRDSILVGRAGTTDGIEGDEIYEQTLDGAVGQMTSADLEGTHRSSVQDVSRSLVRQYERAVNGYVGTDGRRVEPDQERANLLGSRIATVMASDSSDIRAALESRVAASGTDTSLINGHLNTIRQNRGSAPQQPTSTPPPPPPPPTGS